MRGIAEWFIYGEVDWERYVALLRAWGPLLAGVLFGAGWWCWADALVYEKAVAGTGYPFKYNWPGIVATLALILINLMPRNAVAQASESMEEGADFRARLWLFFSFLIACAAMAGSVAVLISTSQQQEHASVGVGSVLQCGLVLSAALLFWSFRSDEQEGVYGYISY